ncbi:leucine-rich repeat-containing protein 17 isoform X1 [Erinaceus europaeus]|uniref:Leucine-rich repeat-containing protein 17 n=1 Tax=Erinaceus europaeus TaxID=9365 RepID=A0A1S3A892_ERIEU|nr:leucine-rich repeat-containing protein 17 isoform X1 [Erinaceus europaeus]
MHVSTVITLLFFCNAAELHKASPEGSGSRTNHGRAGRSQRGSSLLKRNTSVLPCKVHTYLHEKYLDCQEKNLVNVLPGWPQDLQQMLLAKNKIRVLKNNTFLAYQRLKILDLQRNEISKIENGAFFGLNDLTTLLLQHNQIKTLKEGVFAYTPTLVSLRLYDNPWDCTCKMKTFISMLQIPRNNNMGNYAKCESPQKLKNQRLRQIKPEELCREKVKGQLDPKLQLTGNLTVTQPEVNYTLCNHSVFPTEMLDCKRKELKKVPNNIPPNIVTLDLSYNKISQLGPKDFKDVYKLKNLNLRSNAIEYIDPAAFLGLTHLEELDLSNNSLHNIEYGVLEDLYILKLFGLRDNPWRCDYDIHYLFYWLKHHYNVYHNGLECKFPEEYKGCSVGKYIRNYFEECPRDKLPEPPGSSEEYEETKDDVNQETKDDEREKTHSDHTTKKLGVRVIFIG